MRWLVVCAVLAACDPTLTPAPPAVASERAREMVLQYGQTLFVVEPDPAHDPASGPEINVLGAAAPLPTYTDGSGTATTERLMLPLAIDASPGFRHACAVTIARTVLCWGDQSAGALGIRTCKPPTDPMLPPDCVLNAAPIGSLPPVRAVYAGYDVSCAVLVENDRVVCWGDRARVAGSQLFALELPKPVALPDGVLLSASRMLMLGGAVCAVDKSSTLWCWGDGYGSVPVRQPYVGFVDISSNEDHTCVIDAEGLRCWGNNRNGQIDFDHARRCPLDRPCRIDTPFAIDLPAVSVAVGTRHTCAVSRDGDVWCWGSNEFGQLGRDDAFLVGAPEPILGGAAQIGSNGRTTCAWQPPTTVTCWGTSSLESP